MHRKRERERESKREAHRDARRDTDTETHRHTDTYTDNPGQVLRADDPEETQAVSDCRFLIQVEELAAAFGLNF